MHLRFGDYVGSEVAAAELLAGADLVIDAIDNVPTKVLAKSISM